MRLTVKMSRTMRTYNEKIYERRIHVGSNSALTTKH